MATLISSISENINHVCLYQMLYFLAQKGIWKRMAHRTPVRVATGGKRVWASGDSQDKKAEEEAEAKIKGRMKVPSTMQWRGKLLYKGPPKPDVYSETHPKQSSVFSNTTLSYHHCYDTDSSAPPLLIIVNMSHWVNFDLLHFILFLFI